MTTVHEIAPDVFRLCFFRSDLNLGFNHFLIRDDEPLLFHAGMRHMFPELREAVAKVIDPAKLRWISYSHFESDECGALNDWLGIAPHAQAAAGMLGTIVNLQDFAVRPPRMLLPEDVLATGKYRFRFVPTAHVPHGWDSGVLFEETRKTLFCSDLMHQAGQVEPVTSSDILGRAKANLVEGQGGPFAYYLPYNARTHEVMQALSALAPTMLATMHGSSFVGDGTKAILDFDTILEEVLGSPVTRSGAAGR